MNDRNDRPVEPRAARSEPPDLPAPPAPDSAPGGGGDIPLMQRLFDSPFLLLFLGITVMFVFFTGWGIVEIMSLDPAPLP